MEYHPLPCKQSLVCGFSTLVMTLPCSSATLDLVYRLLYFTIPKHHDTALHSCPNQNMTKSLYLVYLCNNLGAAWYTKVNHSRKLQPWNRYVRRYHFHEQLFGHFCVNSFCGTVKKAVNRKICIRWLCIHVAVIREQQLPPLPQACPGEPFLLPWLYGPADPSQNSP